MSSDADSRGSSDTVSFTATNKLRVNLCTTLSLTIRPQDTSLHLLVSAVRAFFANLE